MLHSPPKGLRAREPCWAGQTVVTWFCVLTQVDSIMNVAGIRDRFALINVSASDAVSSVTKWTPATTEGAVGKTGALRPREARVGQTTICRK